MSTTKNEATPRPWQFDSQLPKQTGKGGEEVFKVCSRSGGLIADVSSWWVDRESARANAALIVEAVNQYDNVRELVEAAKEVLQDLDHYVFNHGPGPDRRLANLRAALAKVEDQS